MDESKLVPLQKGNIPNSLTTNNQSHLDPVSCATTHWQLTNLFTYWQLRPIKQIFIVEIFPAINLYFVRSASNMFPLKPPFSWWDVPMIFPICFHCKWRNPTIFPFEVEKSRSIVRDFPSYKPPKIGWFQWFPNSFPTYFGDPPSISGSPAASRASARQGPSAWPSERPRHKVNL